MAPYSASMMTSSDFASTSYWILSLVFGLSSILLLLLCVKKNKEKQYVQSDDMEPVVVQRSRTSTNATGGFDRDTEQRISQHSMPNENRTLPQIPQNGGNGIAHGTPPTPDQAATPGAVSLEDTQRNSASSPKKSRRLPALPPPGQVPVVPVDLAQAAAIAQSDKDIDATYEDLRDDNIVPPQSDDQGEVVGSGDSALYAKVPEVLPKQEDEDSDLYAQVGAVEGTAEQPSTSGSRKNTSAARAGSLSSEEDKTMDSPTAVTYASVDKMKKTMSVKRKNSSSSSTSAPPVPDRNFDEDEEEGENPTSQSNLVPPSPPGAVQRTSSSSSAQVTATAQAQNAAGDEESTGPAYDTVSVRESFAHQRLRQMVEDEQRNRYVNTSREANGNQPDVYSQIDEENSEAVYESVSAPGSADGTVGVTARNIQTNTDASTREDGYSTIGAVRGRGSNSNPPPPPPAPPNGQVVNPDYEDINPR